MDIDVKEIVTNSKAVKEGALFVCIEGLEQDGHDFACEASSQGAVAIVCTQSISLPESKTVLMVKDSRKTLAQIAAVFYRFPAKEMVMIGVTGTKGKTTTTYMIRALLQQQGIKTALIGTIEMDTGGQIWKSRNTTPDALELQKLLREAADSQCQAAVIEVSSQALKMDRVYGITFDIAVLTNIGEDHVGPKEHSSVSEYVYWKSQLFRQCKVAILNQDDSRKDEIMNHCCCDQVFTYGCRDNADLYGENADYVRIPGKLAVEFQTKGMYNIMLVAGAPGQFTMYNALAALLTGKLLGVSDTCAKEALKILNIPGRQETFQMGFDRFVMVDYAHNGDGLTALLKSLRFYSPSRITCVFGCGGNRDRSRRFQMGAAAGKYADFSVITSDNPRNEPLSDIIADILKGIEPKTDAFCVIEDRREAIAFAVEHCIPGEIVVIAGKGHEDYQIIGKNVLYFDDRQEVLAAIEKVKNEQNYNRRN